MNSHTNKRDALYRCLYLRREYAGLQARAALQAAEQEKERLGLPTTTTASSSTAASPAAPPPVPSSSSPSASPHVAASPSRAIPLDDLRDIILLPPPNTAVVGLGEAEALEAGSPTLASGLGTRTIGKDPMLREAQGWPGLVFIRSLPSPWYNGCFPFTVYFPSRYPFEAPIIELGGPLRSHPHVQESRVRDLEEMGVGALGASTHTLDVIDTPVASSMTKTSASSLFSAHKRYFIPFEDVYCALDPMRVSVMSRVLQHVKRFFYPTEWPEAWQLAPPAATPLSATGSPGSFATGPAMTAGGGAASEPYVNRILARRDVDRRSATQEIVLGKPYVDYLGTDVLQYFLTAWEQRMGTDFGTTFPGLAAPPDEAPDAHVADKDTVLFASWYNRVVLPHILALP